MGKKKREYIVFDQMLIVKQSIPFTQVNAKTQQLKEKRNKDYEHYIKFQLP